MRMPTPDTERQYALGTLEQWCSACDWRDTTLKNELDTCPRCGASIAPDCILHLGGTTVVFRERKRRFFLGPPGGAAQEGIIYEADYPDVMTFLLRHGTNWSVSHATKEKRLWAGLVFARKTLEHALNDTPVICGGCRRNRYRARRAIRTIDTILAEKNGVPLHDMSPQQMNEYVRECDHAARIEAKNDGTFS